MPSDSIPLHVARLKLSKHASAGTASRHFSHKILRHICNTAGIERYPGAQFDMVRLGIGLYGIDPFTNKILHNVSTLKTTILADT